MLPLPFVKRGHAARRAGGVAALTNCSGGVATALHYLAETMFANNRYAPATPAGNSRNQSYDV